VRHGNRTSSLLVLGRRPDVAAGFFVPGCLEGVGTTSSVMFHSVVHGQFNYRLASIFLPACDEMLLKLHHIARSFGGRRGRFERKGEKSTAPIRSLTRGMRGGNEVSIRGGPCQPVVEASARRALLLQFFLAAEPGTTGRAEELGVAKGFVTVAHAF